MIILFSSHYRGGDSQSWPRDFIRYTVLHLIERTHRLPLSLSLSVGAVASTALSVIFPPICETITFWPDRLGRFKWQLILNIAIVLFGLYVFVAGTWLSISNIFACIGEGARCDD